METKYTRETVFQVIDNDGKVIYANMLLKKCKAWIRKHAIDETKGYVTLLDKVTLYDKSEDYRRKKFPEFISRSNGLFRRYVMVTTITPHIPEAIVKSEVKYYIINSFHEKHLSDEAIKELINHYNK